MTRGAAAFSILLALIAVAGPAAATQWQVFPPSPSDEGIYEPSAIGQLPDGRVFLVQDEANSALATLTLDNKGRAVPVILDSRNIPKKHAALNDLEALAVDSDGMIYVLSSQSRNLSGKRTSNRQMFVRLRLNGGLLQATGRYKTLLKDMLAAYPALVPSAKSSFAKGRLGFNIEGLSFSGDGGALLIGLRGPVLGGGSLIAVLNNPKAVFDGQAPDFAPDLIRLDLDKGGIRALAYIPALDGFLISAQKSHRKSASHNPFQLWFWSGNQAANPRPVTIAGLDTRKTEGIAQIRRGGRDYLLLVSDDGDRAANVAAHYILLPMETVAASVKGR
ncbi:MAG: hypothetical protein GXP03_15280 [Alphaproteobacteria bacterium]|nr:hypothetical protein [Alphaproteobacteria bacterium]